MSYPGRHDDPHLPRCLQHLYSSKRFGGRNCYIWGELCWRHDGRYNSLEGAYPRGWSGCSWITPATTTSPPHSPTAGRQHRHSLEHTGWPPAIRQPQIPLRRCSRGRNFQLLYQGLSSVVDQPCARRRLDRSDNQWRHHVHPQPG